MRGPQLIQSKHRQVYKHVNLVLYRNAQVLAFCLAVLPCALSSLELTFQFHQERFVQTKVIRNTFFFIYSISVIHQSNSS